MPHHLTDNRGRPTWLMVAWLLVGVTGSLHGELHARVGAPPVARSDSTEVIAAVHRFHAALAAGDSAAVAEMLTTDVTILESGGAETRAQYLGGHLKGDIAYAQAVPSERGPVAVWIQGDVAWASSTSTTRGEYRGRAVNSVGAELMVLRRTVTGWRIAAIHWSSRAGRPAAP